MAAAPVLTVADTNSGNTWTAPAACLGGTGVTVSIACAPAITALSGPPSGYKLSRANGATAANSVGSASAFDNGVLTARVERVGVGTAIARSQFVQTYTYVGPSNTPYVVPFTITRLTLTTNSAAPGDVEQARLLVGIDVTSGATTTAVATLDWLGQSDSASAFTLTPAPTPVLGVSLAPGFLAPPTIIPNTGTVIFGVGGVMLVDLGTFTTGQIFTLDYRMACRVSGTAAGSSYCSVGDPFTIPSGPGFDLLGLATPFPEPTTWSLLIVGFAALGVAVRRRTMRAA